MLYTPILLDATFLGLLAPRTLAWDGEIALAEGPGHRAWPMSRAGSPGARGVPPDAGA